jgi:hypothetical protein
MTVPSPPPAAPRDETSLAEAALGCVRFQRDFARLILPLALLLAVVAGVVTAFRPSFPGRAILDTSKFSLDEWRRLVPILHDPRLVAGTLAVLEKPADGKAAQAEAERLTSLFERPSFWTRQVQYRSALQRDDIREVPNAELRNTSTLGIEISLRANSREEAARQIDATGRHIAQSLLWSLLDGFQRDQAAITTSQRPTLGLRLTKLTFDVEQTQARSADMRALMASFPERPDTTAGTIVSPENGGSRFLSPSAQWVALETKASELQADIRAARRDLERLEWLDRFLTAARAQRDQVQSGFALADRLDAIKTEIFASATAAAAVQARDEISLALAEARARAERIGFTAAPMIESAPVWTRSPLPVAMIVFMASLAALSVLLALYRTIRMLDRPAGERWRATRDPLFAWLPARLRRALFPYDDRPPADETA